jgi:TonB family protein
MRLLALVLVAVGALLAQDGRVWLNLGVTEFKSGNYPQAVADFQKAVDSDPSNPTFRLYLATAWMQQFIPGAETPENRNIAAAAEREFKKVLEVDPGNETAMMYLASLNLNLKQWDEAQSWYEKVVAANPGNSIAWYSMGFIAWSRYYPPYMAARQAAGLKTADPGPLPAGAAKEQLLSTYSSIVEGGLYALQQALVIDPQYDDAMAYMNLLIRERADLRDNAADYRRDTDEANAWVDKAMAAKKAKAQHGAAMGFAAPPPPPPPPRGQGSAGGGEPIDREPVGRIRVSGEVMANMVVRHQPPVYPPDAKKAGISGSVMLSVVVGEDGAVKEVTFREGPQELAKAAMDAVRKWTYKPTLLNDEPVQVETSVTVNFTLQED